jgi:hypothetical protein
MLNVRGLAVNQMLRTSVADGDRGTAQTIPYAKQLIREGSVDPTVRLLAVKYCSGVAPNDEIGEMKAIFDGVLRDFRFIKDPVGTQLLQPAAGVLQTRAGNCATLNLVLFPSLLASVGYPTRAVTIKSDPDRPSEFSHVYIEAQLSNGEWIPLDVARSNPEFGKEPEQYWARKNWPLTDGASAGAYLNGYGGSPMRRGIGATQVVLVRRKRSFPRRGLGQDDKSSFASVNGISQSDYESDQNAALDPVYAPASPVNSLNPNVALATSLAAAPSILTGVAQVIKAQNTPGIAVSGVVSGAGSAVGTSTGSSAGLLLLLVVGMVAWAAMKG